MTDRSLAIAPTFPRYLRVDFIAGLVLAAIAVAILLGAASLDIGIVRNFGPGMLPKLLGTVMLACSAVLMVSGFVQSSGFAARFEFMLRGPAMVGISILVFALTIRGGSVGPLTVPQLGLLVAGPLTVVLAGLGSLEADWRELSVLGLVLTAVTSLVFCDFLSIQVPVFPKFVEQLLPIGWGPDWPARAAYLLYAAIAYALWHAFGLTVAGIVGTERTP